MSTIINGTSSAITFPDGTVQNSAAYVGANGCIYENGQTITANYTITTGKNAMSAGPILIDTSATVTVPTDSTWVIV